MSLAVVLTLVLPMAAWPVAGASIQSSDEQELRAYRLTMPKLRQLAAASAELAKLEAADPRTQALKKIEQERRLLQDKDELTDAETARLEKLDAEAARLTGDDDADDDDDGDKLTVAADAQTISDIARQFEKVPGVAAALARAGLTPREFATIQLALLQASMTYGMMKASGRTTLPASIQVNPDNLKFVQEHEAEIDRLMKSAGAPGGR